MGPHEETDHLTRSREEANTFYRQQVTNSQSQSRSRSGSWQNQTRKQKNVVFHTINQMLRIYKKIIYRIKCCDRYQACPHPFSCLYYTMQVFLIKFQSLKSY